MNINKTRRPTPRQLGKQLERSLGGAPVTVQNEVYLNNTPSMVQAIPEYAPMGGVVISYPGTHPRSREHIQLPPNGPRAFGVPNELIIRLQQLENPEPVQIFIFCADANMYAPVLENLQATAKDMKLPFNPELVHFIPWDTDTYWTRDYCPWWFQYQSASQVKNGSSRFGIAKHTYTTLGGGSVGLVEGGEHVDPMEGAGIFRPNDDYGAVKLSDFLNKPIRQWNKAIWHGQDPLPRIEPHDWFNLGLLDVGGNYMVAGSTLASSYLVATQNELPTPREKQETKPDAKELSARMHYVLEEMNRFLGIDRYMVLVDPEETYIGHIDCWGKFLSDDKVLIAQSQDSKINKHLDKIAHFFETNGFTPFRVMCQNIYVPQAGGQAATTAAYTNSLILNNQVYVPAAGGVYHEYDEKARVVYEKAMGPEYKIHLIEGKRDFPWLGTDALHCRTRGIPRTVVNDWLRAKRQPNP